MIVRIYLGEWWPGIGTEYQLVSLEGASVESAVTRPLRYYEGGNVTCPPLGPIAMTLVDFLPPGGFCMHWWLSMAVMFALFLAGFGAHVDAETTWSWLVMKPFPTRVVVKA